jgi:hypothetical protein
VGYIFEKFLKILKKFFTFSILKKKGVGMEDKYDIKGLSLELRERIKEELLAPLIVLEKTSGPEFYPKATVNKVFRQFRKINEGIWESLHKKIKGKDF